MLLTGLISWFSKRQTVVGTLTSEVKYVRECNTAKESVFLANSLKKIGYEKSDGDISLFFADNLAPIKLAINPVNHFYAKHIDIQYHKLRKLISDDAFELDYIPTKKMIVNRLTKFLTFTKYEYFITILELENKRQK